MDKKINLPENDFIDGDDVEGHKAGKTPSDDMWAMNKPTEDSLGSGVADDVEGHRAAMNKPTDDMWAMNKPADDSQGSGVIDDVEGHRAAMNQPTDDENVAND